MLDGSDVARLVEHPELLTARDGILLTLEHEPVPHSWAMRLMQSPFLARFYEQPWRPITVRAVSTLNYAAEDAIVDRHLGGQSGLRLLDLCCGTARAGRRWIPRGAEVLGVDNSLAMLGEARRRCMSERLVLVHGDAATRYALSGAFDAAFCFAALHLLKEPSAVIDTARAALRSEGIFFAWEVSCSGMLRSAWAQWLATGVGVSPRQPGWLPAAIANCGFDVLERVDFGAIEFVVGLKSG